MGPLGHDRRADHGDGRIRFARRYQTLERARDEPGVGVGDDDPLAARAREADVHLPGLVGHVDAEEREARVRRAERLHELCRAVG